MYNPYKWVKLPKCAWQTTTEWESVSHLIVTLGTIALWAPLSMGFSRQEYWSGLSFPSPGDLPDPGIKPRSPTLQQILYHQNHWRNNQKLLLNCPEGYWFATFCCRFLVEINYIRIWNPEAWDLLTKFLFSQPHLSLIV